MIAVTLLAVFTIYIIVAILVTRFFIKRARTRKGKWLKGLAAVAIFVLIPTWDAILGTIYFRYLCATEGGVRIYKTAELSEKYWTPDGKLKLVPTKGPGVEYTIGEKYRYVLDSLPEYSQLFNIDKDTYRGIDARTGEILGIRTNFIYFGGWLVNSTGFHVSGEVCSFSQIGNHQEVLRQIFGRQT